MTSEPPKTTVVLSVEAEPCLTVHLHSYVGETLIYGIGPNVDMAMGDLVADLLGYARQWEEEFSQASNHVTAEPFVRWVLSAEQDEIIEWLYNSVA